MAQKTKILVVDDEKIVRMRLGRLLAAEGYQADLVSSGAQALAALEKAEYDLVLADMVLEDMDGLELLKRCGARYPGTIFIIVTGHGSLASAIESMRLGAFDYLLKPLEDSELKLRIERGIKERRLLKKMEEQQRKLEQMAVTDGLTGLYSRSYFMETLEREFRHVKRYGSPLSFMMADIDHFKSINDAFGHQAGDSVLHQVARSIRGILREADILGRYGGDEFGILQPRTDEHGALRSAQRILQAVRSTDPSGQAPAERMGPVTLSIGIASCPHPGIRSAAELIEAADSALYKAKRAGRNRCVVFREKAGGSESE